MNKYDKKMMHLREQISDDKKAIHRTDQQKKGFRQEMDGDMGSFDVMSEPAPIMSRSANKVNRHSAANSSMMQTKSMVYQAPKERKLTPKEKAEKRRIENQNKIEATKVNMSNMHIGKGNMVKNRGAV